MCGRYSQSKAPERVRERFGLRGPIPPEFAPRYNIAPSQDAPVIVRLEDARLEMFHWGLIPSWAKDPAIGNRLINARAETIAEKPSFRKPFKRTRCLVVADGFYEWKVNPDGKTKTPMRVRLRSDEPFAMAGLWDSWTGPDGKEIKSFSIVTTAASESIAQIHDRMPVILKRGDEAGWLDPETKPETLKGMLKPYPADAIESYAITKIVNSPKNDNPDCFKPAKNREGVESRE